MARETLEQAAAAGRRARQDTAEREERIANCEMEWTDGFLSTWAEGLTAAKGANAEAILENGGKWGFWRCELIDAETGERIEAKLIDGAYGECWLLKDAAAIKRNGGRKFITAHPARKATMERKGVLERIVLFEAEARADIAGSGRGLSGAHTCRAVIKPADYELEWTGTAGSGGREGLEAHAETLRENGFGWQEMIFA
jgi:hypothetical protein